MHCAERLQTTYIDLNLKAYRNAETLQKHCDLNTTKRNKQYEYYTK